jgi:hypothetical protein
LRENYSAQKAKVELELLTGSVLPREEAIEVIETVVAVCNRRLWAIPSRAAVLLETARTPFEREEILNGLLDEAMDDLNRLDIEYVEKRVSNGKKPRGKRGNGAANQEAQDGSQT